MKVPEAPSTFTKMAAFYRCLKPEPRWASESQEVVGGGAEAEGRSGGRPGHDPQPLGSKN